MLPLYGFSISCGSCKAGADGVRGVKEVSAAMILTEGQGWTYPTRAGNLAHPLDAVKSWQNRWGKGSTRRVESTCMAGVGS